LANGLVASGSPLGQEFRVNTATAAVKGPSPVAADAAGDFVVVWDDNAYHDGSGFGAFGQRYDEFRSPLGPEFRINTYTTNNQGHQCRRRTARAGSSLVWNSFRPGWNRTSTPSAKRYNMIGPRRADALRARSSPLRGSCRGDPRPRACPGFWLGPHHLALHEAAESDETLIVPGLRPEPAGQG
jgi:hypothetical protein